MSAPGRPDRTDRTDRTGTAPVATLVELFDRSAAAYPDRPAVSDDRQTLTYRELQARSAALAADLVARGVRTEDAVAVHLPRGADVPVAVLGALRAGAAYVAVDRRYPQARRELMIRNSRARLVLTGPGDTAAVAAADAEVVEFASRPAAGAPTPGGGPAVPVAAEDAASILFTSGSTGTPKTILLEHRNLVAFATNPALPPLLPTDRTGAVSSVSFDAFHFELWCTLAYGAELVVLPTMPELLDTDLQRELRRHRITAMLAPTSAFNAVVREDRDAFATLRLLHVGGDVILPAACRDLLAGGFAGQLVNLYGPSEITTACTSHPVTEVPADAASVPIGRPLTGVTVHVLDEQGVPVRPGEAGELHVGGTGVARGYLGQPELTAERFRPAARTGERLYATGDLVREGPGGVLEFVGRRDSQVKIRGYRVELGEVERALGRLPAVREAAVLALGRGMDARLVAVVVLTQPTSPRALRAAAAEQLPDFLLPSAILVADGMPYTENGKRDVPALLALVRADSQRRAAHVPPAGEIERYLATLWEELLAVEEVGATDDFFALGGNSLLAFRAQRKISRELGAQIKVRDVLDNARLRDVAALIADRRVPAGAE
jgi:amino acid adenylation domain-containing protein